MARFLTWRLASTLFVLFGVAAAVFTLMNTLPGDPAAMLVSHFGASAKDIEILREQLGLNDPFPVRFGRFLLGAVHGDLGKSFQQNRPVARILLENSWPTVQLALVSVGLATVLGVLAGVAAAVRRGSWADFLTMVISLFGISMPGFWLGLMLMLVFAVQLRWLPALGGQGWSGMALPALTLALPAASTVARLTRSSMLEVLGEDYLRSARAKGLPERTVVYRHALRNALISIITFVGLQFGLLLGGSVVVESLFSRQGLGQLVVAAVFARDIPIVQGWCLVIAVTYSLVNLLVDLSYALVNPRIRYDAR
ncbi:MAG TPA: ABC transporter permease [Methylomirabilota bacterium]|nr:ABC transporter permease [Methylomirabilota bacterium]